MAYSTTTSPARRKTHQTAKQAILTLEPRLMFDGAAAAAVNDAAVAKEWGGTNNATGGTDASGNVLTNDTGTSLSVTAVRTGSTEGSGTPGSVGQQVTGSYGWLTLNGNGTFSYTPNGANGTVNSLPTGGTLTDTFNYTVTDGSGNTDIAVLSITINGTNDAPAVAIALPDQTAFKDSAFSYQFAAGSFADPDTGATVTYTATLAGGGALPGWLTFDAATRTFSGTPTTLGTISVRVTASDGQLSVSDDFDISVQNASAIPVVTGVTGLNPTFEEGSSSSVDLFGGTIVADTRGSGEVFTEMTLTVSGVRNGANEVLIIGGVEVSVSSGNSYSLPGYGASGGNASISVTTLNSVTTVRVYNLSASDSQMSTLVDGIGYRNFLPSAMVTAGDRVVTLSTVKDNGATDNSSTVNVSSTVHVIVDSTAPTVSSMTVTSNGNTQSSSTTIGSQAYNLGDKKLVVTLNFNETMDVTSTPVITWPTALTVGGNATFTLDSGYWNGDHQYVAKFDTADVDAASSNVTISVTGAKDKRGNEVTYNASNLFKVDMSAPVVTTNTGATVAEGSTSNVITAAMLAVSDAVSSSLTIAITGITGGGTLKYNGSAIGSSGTFNPVGIGQNRLTFDAPSSAGTTTVTFTVSDGANVSSAQTFTITTLSAGQAALEAPVVSGATGLNPSFEEGSGTTVDLFGGTIVADTQGSGEVFTEMTLTVSGVQNGGNEKLVIGGVDVGLYSGNSYNLPGYGASGGNASISVTTLNSVTTVRVYNLSASNSQMAALVDGIGYKNILPAAMVTAGNRVVTLSTVKDSGSIGNASTPNVSSTVNVVVDSTAPTVSSMTVASNGNTQSSATTIGSQAYNLGANKLVVTLNFNETMDMTSTPVITWPTGLAVNGNATFTFAGGYWNGDHQYIARFNTADVDAASSNVTATITGAKDKRGNEVNYNASNLFKVDMASPVVTINTGTSVVEGSTSNVITAAMLAVSDPVSSSLTITITGITGGGALKYNGGTLSAGSTFNPVGIGENRLTFDASSTAGTTTVTFTVSDGSNVSSTQTFTLVTSSPVPSAPDMTADSDTGVSDTDNITTVTTPTFTGTAMAGATVRLYDSDGTTVIGTGIADGAGRWSITVSSPLSTGTHIITAKTIGNGGSSSIASTATTVTIESPNNGNSNGNGNGNGNGGGGGIIPIATAPQGLDGGSSGLQTIVRASAKSDGGLGTGTGDFGTGLGGGPSGDSISGIAGNTIAVIPAVTTAPGAGAFLVAVMAKAAGAPDALVVNQRIADTSFDVGSRISVTIPTAAFADTRADARVTLSATREDGAALPGWLVFNPQTGTFEGTPPPGFRGEVAVKVTARDNGGREAVQTFRIVVGEAGRGNAVPGRSGSLDSEGKLARSVGRPSLTEQLRAMGKEGRLARAAVLFGKTRSSGNAA